MTNDIDTSENQKRSKLIQHWILIGLGLICICSCSVVLLFLRQRIILDPLRFCLISIPSEATVVNAIRNPLIDVSIEGARNLLVNVSGSASMQLHEVKRVVELVTEQVNPGAEVIYGALIVPELEDKLRVTIIASGVSSPYVFDADGDPVAPLAEDLVAELGLPRLN